MTIEPEIAKVPLQHWVQRLPITAWENSSWQELEQWD
jgi:hypothetical protein